MTNIRVKGASAEREVADRLNGIICLVHQEAGVPYPEKPIVQRNQNQSAVGGCDLVGTGKFAIEVKRHENLSINTWWKQCEKSAAELMGTPVLIFRQSRQAWRVIMHGHLTYNGGHNAIQVRTEVSFDDFCVLFKKDYELRLAASDFYKLHMEQQSLQTA